MSIWVRMIYIAVVWAIAIGVLVPMSYPGDWGAMLPIGLAIAATYGIWTMRRKDEPAKPVDTSNTEEIKKERQCLVCGEWKPLEIDYTYAGANVDGIRPNGESIDYCKDCFTVLDRLKDGDSRRAWADKKRTTWDYSDTMSETNRDREVAK